MKNFFRAWWAAPIAKRLRVNIDIIFCTFFATIIIKSILKNLPILIIDLICFGLWSIWIIRDFKKIIIDYKQEQLKKNLTNDN